MSKEAMRAAVDALEHMLVGCVYKDIAGDEDWHQITMPKRQVLNKARAALSLLRAELEAGGEAEGFDHWMQNPYTKVLMDSIKNDYMPRVDAEALIRAASPVAADTQGDAKDAVVRAAKRVAEQRMDKVWSEFNADMAALRTALEELK